jgi:hypothetical protein
MNNEKIEGAYVIGSSGCIRNFENITIGTIYKPVEIISEIYGPSNVLVRTIIDLDLKDKDFDRYVVLTISNKYYKNIKITCDDNIPIDISSECFRIFNRVSWTPECWNYSPEFHIEGKK